MIKVTQKELDLIKNILKNSKLDCEARAFGSRCRENCKENSDLDLAILNKNYKLNLVDLEKLKEAFQESDLPFRVDLLNYYDISDEFRKIIDENYVTIFKS